jgi:hypothetical protein
LNEARGKFYIKEQIGKEIFLNTRYAPMIIIMNYSDLKLLTGLAVTALIV